MPGHDIEAMYDVINLPKTIKFSLFWVPQK